MTFSNIAMRGCSSNKTSQAAKKVSPEHPLSSMSIRYFVLSMLKFLHEVPATNILKGGSGVCCP